MSDVLRKCCGGCLDLVMKISGCLTLKMSDVHQKIDACVIYAEKERENVCCMLKKMREKKCALFVKKLMDVWCT